ncbi:MAG: hypothetical protein ACR2QT_10355 [Woeseiaceae bacterium]
MKSKLAYAFIATLLPSLIFAQGTTSYQCNFENLQRRIEILTEPGVTVPCEVHYYKDSESPGAKQVLWTATSEEGYCEARTMEFVAKLREWGWQCAPNASAEPAMTTAPAEDAASAEEAEVSEAVSDDTAALEPAEQ